MAATSSSASDAADRSIEAILKENAAIQAEINALKGRLGITTKEATEEKKKVNAVFASYDINRDGALDATEFTLLGASSGAKDIDAKQLAEVFAAIEKKDATRVTFEEFYAWFKAARLRKPSTRKQAETPALKLQRKAWAVTLAASRRALRRAKPAGSASTRVRRAEIPSAFTPVATGIRARFQVGEFKEAATAIRFHTKTDAEAAATLRRDVEAPTGKNTFAYVDLAIIPGADEGKLGELAGVLEGLLGALGGSLNEKIAAMGTTIYHSHTVKIAKDAAGNNVLRIAAFADANPVEIAALATGKDPAVFSPENLINLSWALETPLAFGLLGDDAAHLTLADIRARFVLEGQLHSSLDHRVRDVIVAAGLGEEKARVGEAAAKFLRGLNIDLGTCSLEELAARFPDPASGAEPRGPGEFLKLYGAQLPLYPIKGLFNAGVGGLIATAFGGGEAPAEVRGIYDLVRSSLLGPSRVHLQIDNTEFAITFVGVEVFPLLPSL